MFDMLLKPVKKIVDHAAPSVFYNVDRAASYPFYSAYPVRMNHVARTGENVGKIYSTWISGSTSEW